MKYRFPSASQRTANGACTAVHLRPSVAAIGPGIPVAQCTFNKSSESSDVRQTVRAWS
jgi:hypothetical protein